MARKYQREELMRLRDSPLARKPSGLPPTEEWMGYVSLLNSIACQSCSQPADQFQILKLEERQRLTADRESTPVGPQMARTHRVNADRPSGSNEGVVLGPPKTAFASAGRKGPTATNGSYRSLTSSEQETTQKERGVLRERPIREWPKGDREQSRDTRSIGFQRSRGEDALNDPQSQTTEEVPDQDNAYRRNGDRDSFREKRDRLSGDAMRGNGRGLSDRANWQSRNTDEPHWHKSEDKRETGEAAFRKSRDWRDKSKENRPWEQGPRQDLEPEWLDEPEPEERKQTYTQDDFEQWKAKMKAGNAEKTVKTETIAPEPAIQATETTRKPSKPSRPLVLGDGFDNFLGLGNQTTKDHLGSARSKDNSQQFETTGSKMSKASKFSSLFNTSPPAPVVPEPRSPSPAPMPLLPSHDTSAEDKAGFARILSLLGQQQGPTPADVIPPPSAKPRKQLSSPLHSPSASGNQSGFDFMRQKSPPAARPPSKDSEFLLHLMQKPSHLQAAQFSGLENRRQYNEPGFLAQNKPGPSYQDRKDQLLGPSPPGPFFNDLNLNDAKIRDGYLMSPTGDRRPPPGLPDIGWAGGQHRSTQLPGLAQGMTRPPGFEGHSGGHNPGLNMAPPPGFPAQYRGGMPPPGLMSNAQYGARIGGGPSNPPSGGYMSVNGPPPGLPNHLFTPHSGPHAGYAESNYNENLFGPSRR